MRDARTTVDISMETHRHEVMFASDVADILQSMLRPMKIKNLYAGNSASPVNGYTIQVNMMGMGTWNIMSAMVLETK